MKPIYVITALAGLLFATAGCSSNKPCCGTMTTAVQQPVAAPAAPAEKCKLKFVRVDSEETAGENGAGANAVDGNPNTIWHTQWQDANPECPHEIVIELVPPSAIKGFTYLPRQDDSDHGQIKNYEFYTSDDGQNFGARSPAANLKTPRT